MDEILASIRRIISEDAAAGGPTDASLSASEEDEDVLVLTDRAPPEPEAEISAAPRRDVALASVEDRAITDPAGGVSAVESFEKLYFVVENARPPAPLISSSGPTLEDLTREMLKPMIKAWLDENLDAIVQARVDEEVERISRGRVR